MLNTLDLSEYKPVNSLWNDFCEQLGEDKASKAILQAIDLQHMAAKKETLPVLFLETCGVGLINVEVVKNQIGVSLQGENQILILSAKKKIYQFLKKSS